MSIIIIPNNIFSPALRLIRNLLNLFRKSAFNFYPHLYSWYSM